MTTETFKKPVPSPEFPEMTEPFWEATKRHELVIPHCAWCNHYFWYPRQNCPFCLRTDWTWEKVSGHGRVYSFTVVRQPVNPAFNPDVPYAYAIIELDEGVRMISNIVECKVPDEVQINMPVQAVFQERVGGDNNEAWTLVMFRPA